MTIKNLFNKKENFNPVKISWKSSLPFQKFGWGIEYKVMFEDIPSYLKKQWLKYANDACVSEDEKLNPKIEMNAVLCEGGEIVKDICFQYYFNGYEYFTLKVSDEEKAVKKFVEFIKKNDNNLLDAYDFKTDSLMGEVEWNEKAYK